MNYKHYLEHAIKQLPEGHPSRASLMYLAAKEDARYKQALREDQARYWAAHQAQPEVQPEATQEKPKKTKAVVNDTDS